MTTLAELTQAGGFVDAAPVKKSISFDIAGETYTADVYIKRISVAYFDTLREAQLAGKSQTQEILKHMVAFGNKGEEQLSEEQCSQLHPSLATALIEAFNEVNSNTKKG